MEITGRGCCLAILIVIAAILGAWQGHLLILKLNGGLFSWWWTFAPLWGTILVVFGVPVLFSVVDKLVKLIKTKRHDKA